MSRSSYLDDLPPPDPPPRGRPKNGAAGNANDWRRGLRKRGERYVGDELGVLAALRTCPELVGLARFNEFQNRIEFGRPPPWRDLRSGDPWTDGDDLNLHAFLQRAAIDVRVRSVVADAIELVARDKLHHPVRTWLGELAHDGTPRLDLWLVAYLDARDEPEYLAAVGRKFLISAVARIYKPGCKADHALVLEGPQGIGKSTVVRILGAPWTTDSVPEFSGADAALQLAGVWIAELSELSAMRRADVETVKGFLSRTEDHFRPPYGRRPVRVPRQSVFIGTTNESQYLRDPTGNRRFWPVRCGSIDLESLTRYRDQLLAEARDAYLDGERWHLDAAGDALAAAQQQQRLLVTELEEQVVDYLDRLRLTGDFEVTMRDVLARGCNLDPLAGDYAIRAGQIGPQAAAAMQRAGWRRVGARGRGEVRRVVYRYDNS